ncbi:MAG TPA: glycosyltransferase family 4 protein [Candidatus Binatia bacterium]|jgi:glycosyltransferase involved in cell wall biosynthesis|nr:glycosyltransferase family 4 protein [Candidatus Binatia bacterium]
MKLLVFAHTPPPHHGQSYMVQLMLEGLGGDQRKGGSATTGAPLGVKCYHVNARLSRKLEDIGDLRVGKFFLLLGYCLQAIWCRLRYGVSTFYYIPAPGKPSALYRDWLVMLLCRPFFKRIVLHWHAAGLAKWLETTRLIRVRAATYRLMGQVDLSIVLSKYNRADAEKLFSRRIRVISNGIPDPCPGFGSDVLPTRKARLAARQRLLSGQAVGPGGQSATSGEPHLVKVLYLAHCAREKGLFDALAGVVLANRQLADRQSRLSLRLVVAGSFVREEDQKQFEARLAELGALEWVRYHGFVAGDQKNRLLREADLFCFPTFYENENQPVNLIEAMAFGLPILTTRWRSIPELFPPDYPGLVDIHAPDQVAQALQALLTSEAGEGFRDMFLRKFTLEQYLSGLAEAFHDTGHPVEAAALLPRPSGG